MRGCKPPFRGIERERKKKESSVNEEKLEGN
jgi:hypothetical protein